MPFIWLLNMDEPTFNSSYPETSDTRKFIPEWTLQPGLHIEAEAKLITRRLITSTVLRDIFFKEPVGSQYNHLTFANPSCSRCTAPYLYIQYVRVISYLYSGKLGATFSDESGTSYYTNASTATATVRLASRPGFMYFRTLPSDAVESDLPRSCDFVDDYRSSTIFDAIGSIGGLFALLQALHIMLFGRPLFWGLTGQFCPHVSVAR
jgi:hypothetical protein